MNDSYEEYRIRAKALEREGVASLNSAELVMRWDELNDAEEAAKEALRAERSARDRYTEMLAEVKGFKIGDRVQRQESRGYGASAKTRTATYEIVGFAPASYGDSIRLLVKTVRKDGSLGERREIGGNVTKISAAVQK